jgi:S-adenosylhomocysteine hydrolase
VTKSKFDNLYGCVNPSSTASNGPPTHVAGRRCVCGYGDVARAASSPSKFRGPGGGNRNRSLCAMHALMAESRWYESRMS